jgi:pilus assembly protein TadC
VAAVVGVAAEGADPPVDVAATSVMVVPGPTLAVGKSSVAVVVGVGTEVILVFVFMCIIPVIVGHGVDSASES